MCTENDGRDWRESEEEGKTGGLLVIQHAVLVFRLLVFLLVDICFGFSITAAIASSSLYRAAQMQGRISLTTFSIDLRSIRRAAVSECKTQKGQ